ncbi:uroporphyrinogen-III decarboxylase [Candidatus Methanoplasma termitum]|uniref:Uroporphyrinogen-III decarboxylase n=1 Tax=Candidatus Methanoplasma termitum TaxID=1577791 RepID=A0A0A7LFJ0_9ARCH|nr:uroporphyrinogen decarboxylase family protein [Candidatus Methanoplasma termitum]AIZ56261.1 uroporphyrinogen-III decarboxylase [Candidatus Methanoplasma termitum]MCL2333724.1 uroporphyrinogen decarboxylase family protein [Candidatus Methanoplasma sp.]
MKDAGHRESVRSALKHERGDRIPVNNFALVTAARSAGYTVEQARKDPKISAKVSIDYSIKTLSDFVKPVLDSQVPFADLGMDVRFPEDDYGYIKSHPVKDPEDIDKLALFDPNAAKECPMFTKVIVEGLRETSRMLEEDLHICGLSWGPITTAGYLMGTEEMIMMALMEPDMVKKLMVKVAPFVAEMQRTMIDAGATVMWMADPTSSGDLLSPSMFKEFSYLGLKEVIPTVKKEKDVPSFLHICGNTLEIMPMLPELKVDCFSFDHAVDPGKAKKLAGKKMALMGNIDPVKYIMSGNPAEIKDECRRIIDLAGRDGGFILSPGCETPISSPDVNVRAMGQAGQDYWKHR